MPSISIFLSRLTDKDDQGELLWCLSVRRDMRVMAGAYRLLVNKGFHGSMALLLMGYLHMLYMFEPVCYALSLMLMHPAVRPLRTEALASGGDQLRNLYTALEQILVPHRVVLLRPTHISPNASREATRW